MFIQVVEGNKRAGIPDKYNIFIARGDDTTLTVTIENIESLDGYSIEFGMRQYPTSSDLLISKVSDTPVDGKFTIPIDSADTSDLEFGKYCYDVKLFDPQGKKRTIVYTSDFNVLTEVAYHAMLQ